jgi:hypothetical protein
METIKQDGKPTICAISIEATMLYRRLSKLTEGEEISYTELSVVAGRNVQTAAYGALKTAREMCRRENRIIIGTVKNVGLKRLSNEEIPDSAKTHISRIRKQAKIGFAKLACTDLERLPDSGKLAYYAAESNLGALALFSKPASAKRIEDKVCALHEALPVGRVMDLFKG